MSKDKMNRQLTQNQKGEMSDDPRDGTRNSDTLGRDGAVTAVERAPDQDRRAPEEFDRKIAGAKE